MVITILRLLGGEYHRYLERKGKLPDYPKTKKKVVAIVIAYKEKSFYFNLCLLSLRETLRVACDEFTIIVVIDGIRRQVAASKRMGELAKKYAHYVFGTDTADKRNSITRAMEFAEEQQIPGDLVIIRDSDTFSRSALTGVELLKPFADPMVGVVSTAQTIYRPTTLADLLSDWFEHARLNSSMRALSLPNIMELLCAPGREIAIRRDILLRALPGFNNEYLLGKKCIPGDDRFLTLAAQKEGYKTVLAHKAEVWTLAKKTFWLTFKMWLRWGRTSQRYTILNPWLISKKPFAAFVAWTDIYTTLAVSVIVFMWIITLFTKGNLAVPFVQAVLFSFGGMVLSMGLRQARYLIEHPRKLWLLPFFTIVATIGQLIRLWALFTMFDMRWLSREGTDQRIDTTDQNIYLLYKDGKKVD